MLQVLLLFSNWVPVTSYLLRSDDRPDTAGRHKPEECPFVLAIGCPRDWQEWEELQLQPGHRAAAADRWRLVSPSECHCICPHGKDLPCDFQVNGTFFLGDMEDV